MTYQRPTGHPSRLTAGDTWAWDYTNSTYPATDNYTLSVALVGPGTLLWNASFVVVVGATYQITILPAATLLPPGVYKAFYLFASGGSRYSVAAAEIVVLPNPSTVQPGDLQSWEEKTLAVIEDRLAGRVDDDIMEYSIDGVQVRLIPIKDLISLQAKLRGIINRRRRRGRNTLKRVVFTSG